MKFDRWPRKTIGHFFYTKSSFVHHFKSIGEFKLDLQSRNAQFGSKLVIRYPVSFKLCIISNPLVNSNRIYSPETLNWGRNWWYVIPCPLNCASFQIHWWIQTGFTVQKRSIGVEIGDMLSRVSLEFDGWPCKTIGHLFYATSSFVHFVPIGKFKLKLQSGNAQCGSKLTIFLAVWPRNFTDDPHKR